MIHSYQHRFSSLLIKDAEFVEKKWFHSHPCLDVTFEAHC